MATETTKGRKPRIAISKVGDVYEDKQWKEVHRMDLALTPSEAQAFFEHPDEFLEQRLEPAERGQGAIVVERIEKSHHEPEAGARYAGSGYCCECRIVSDKASRTIICECKPCKVEQ